MDIKVVVKGNIGALLTVLLAVLICSRAIAAIELSGTELDSLKRLVARTYTIDTSQVNACYELGKYYLYDSTEQAQKYASQGIDIADFLGFQEGRGHCLNLLAMSNEITGQLEEALILYEDAFASLSQSGDLDAAAGVLVNMGVAHYYAGNRGEALKHYLRALEYVRNQKLLQQESKLLNNIAIVYRELKQYDQAISIYKKSLDLKMSLGDSLGYANTLENLGLAYSYIDDEHNAVNHLNQAIDWYQKVGQVSEADQAQLSLGSIYIQLGRWHEAQAILTTVLDEQLRLLPHYRASCHLMLARIKLHYEDFAEALQLLQKGYSIIENSNRDELKARYYAVYAETYKALGDFEKALTFTDQRMSILDTLNKLDRIETEREMKAKFDLQEKEARLLIQEQKIDQKNRESRWFAALLLISSLLVVVMTIFAITKSRSNKALLEKNKIIDRSLREKEVLLKEIHHRVKNNLQVVSSLLSLQARSLKGEEALEALAKGKDRVRSMALIHQNLYQEEHLTGVNAREYIDRLSRSLLSSYSVAYSTIQLKTDVEPLILDVDTVIPLGLILNELITNALKYAFPSNAGGEIFISLKKRNHILELIVKDNGKGIPDNIWGTKKTMGYRLIQSFVQKLKGTYQISVDQGTRVSFQFQAFHLVDQMVHQMNDN
ncbi:MAG: tetratricopeptide repeat protein [Saprospiraceae bacterium]|nr:tetratricopeptide repeat protein [Saprospiraceae bacterium]